MDRAREDAARHAHRQEIRAGGEQQGDGRAPCSSWARSCARSSRSIPIQVTKALRLTQKMADIIQVDESVLMGLTSIKDYDEYTYAHSVNVCVLSMAIADRLGLPKAETAEIGVAGLLHDIGKMHVPLSILNKPEQLSSEEWDSHATPPHARRDRALARALPAHDHQPALRGPPAPRAVRGQGIPRKARRMASATVTAAS